MANPNPSRPANLPPGVTLQHQYRCPKQPCSCTPKLLAGVYSKTDAKKIRKSFATLPEAKRWLNAQRKERDDGNLSAPTKITLAKAAGEFLRQAQSGEIRKRGGQRYKPSAIRSYEASLRMYVLPVLGTTKLNEVSRRQLQRLVGRWQAEGMSASSIGNHINALRAIYANVEALTDGACGNPTQGLRGLPAREGRRDRIASPGEAASLLAALRAEDRALWATAFYAGLRRGELRALDWSDVDLASGVIRVRAAWDDDEGEIGPKSIAGARRIPILGRLRDALVEHKAMTGRDSGLVFGRTETRPFNPTTINGRARRAWEAHNDRVRAEAEQEGRPVAPGELLVPIGLHECRHTCASYMIAAGVNAKALSTYMGHASIGFTYDRYGHMMPGNEAEAAAALDALMDRADTASRLAALD
jgi:integrase